MADILQTDILALISCMKILVFWLKFHYNLFPRVQLAKAELVQIMTWCQTEDRPLSEWKMVQFTDTYMPHSASMS